MRKALVLISVCLTLQLTLPGGDLGFADFVQDLIDLEGLSKIDAPQMLMESSYDRTGGNDDGFNPAWLKDGVYTIANIEGPGVVRRMWTARPEGRLRIYLDGNTRPVIDMLTEDFFAGRKPPFERPVAGPMGGGNYSYFPLPFHKSIKIQITPRPGGNARAGYGAYHHVYYQRYPSGTTVRSLEFPLPDRDRLAFERVLGVWRNPGDDPKGVERPLTVEREVTTAALDTAVLADLAGPGAIDALHIDISPRDPKLLRDLLLRISWDGQAEDSVDCPLGDFFVNGFNFIPFKSLPLGLTENGFYSYFSMPFAKRARIRLVNESEAIPVRIKYRVVYHQTPQLAPGIGYFHAKWRREQTVGVNMHLQNRSGDYNYQLLAASGPGRFVGTSLNVFNHYFNWWGEGDHMIFVDGEEWPPKIHGTGTEEYFNDAWGFHDYSLAPGADRERKEQNVNPTSGVLIPGIGVSHYWGPNSIFVFHIADSVPFRENILVTLEHGSENEMTNDYSNTAYWYAPPQSRDFFLMRPAEERLNLAPSRWEEVRKRELQKYVEGLRRDLLQISKDISGRPTDHSTYRTRVRLLRYIIRNSDALGLSPSDRKKIQSGTDTFRNRPLEQRWPLIDSAIQEAARMLPEG